MKYITKYWPLAAIILAFVAGNFTAPDNTKDLSKKYEQEQNAILEVIGQKDAKIIELTAESQKIRKQMSIDSLKYSNELKVNKKAYSALKKKYNEINLNRATAHTLDSLLLRLYPN